MTSGKKVGGPLTKTKFQKKNEIWTNSEGGVGRSKGKFQCIRWAT